MEILTTINELKSFLEKNHNKKLGFVPTMGALHKGHEAIIKKCADENEISLVSIFVNPTQFLPNEDFINYPRTRDSDIKLAKNANVTAIFLPDIDEIYSSDEVKILAPANLSSILEGACRPGHFDGVCTVLTKFFNLIRPTKAYFGKKDAQQLIIVQNLVKNLFFDIEIVACDIVRASDGLALSSRNSYLSESELLEACRLYRALLKAKNLINANNLDANFIKEEMSKILEPLKVEYIAICDRNLNTIPTIKENESIILVAAFVGKTRLIDNFWL